MRIPILAAAVDVNGRLHALRTMAVDLRGRSPDAIANLGDPGPFDTAGRAGAGPVPDAGKVGTARRAIVERAAPGRMPA